jgi:hypothetical protein
LVDGFDEARASRLEMLGDKEARNDSAIRRATCDGEGRLKS